MSDATLPRSRARKPRDTAGRTTERAVIAFAAAVATLLLLYRGGTRLAATNARFSIKGLRLASTPPTPSCPSYVLDRAKRRTPVPDFRECLLAHGRTLDEGAPDRYWRAAAQAEGKKRLNLLAEHVLEVWLWTLAQQAGTPCKPMIVMTQCLEGKPCKGIGDRVKSLQTAFWMAVMTNSIFVHDIRVPAPLEEFFVPIKDEIHFSEYRGCSEHKMRRLEWWPGRGLEDPELLAEFNVSTRWKDHGAWSDHDYIHVRHDMNYLAQVLKMRHYQATLERLQMQHLPLADFLYITNRIYLSQPSQRLQALAQPLLATMSAAGPATHKVGVHIRIGDSAISNAVLRERAQFPDARYPIGATACWARQVAMQCHAVQPRPCACFLATDSAEVKQLFTSNMSALGIPTVMVPGEASHIDFINGTDREAVIVAAQGTYLDWYMLTQMDGLTLSFSGFSLTAAYSTLAKTITYMRYMRQSRRHNEKQGCVFEDFTNRCVGDICPGQVSDENAELYAHAWTMGNITQPWR